MNLSNETEQKILDSAVQIFLEKGKDGAKMQEIAEKAGINKALLHYYYRSKDKLYSFALRSIVRTIITQILTSSINKSSMQELIREIISRYIDRISHHPQLINFIIWEVQQSHGKIIADIITEKDDSGMSIFDRMISKINEAKAAGEIKDIHPLHIYSSIIGLCAAPYFARPVLEKIFPDIKVTEEPFISERKEFVFNLVWNYIKKEN